jgi:hypothetical protein
MRQTDLRQKAIVSRKSRRVTNCTSKNHCPGFLR